MLSIRVPPLGESITEATVSRWLKQEGDPVAAGETIVELETDKITVEVPALKDGVLARRGKNEGDVVRVDDVLGDLNDGAGTAAHATTIAAAPAPAAPPAPVAPSPFADHVAPAAGATAPFRSAPTARQLADEVGLDLRSIPGTGLAGSVSKPDVVAAIAAMAAIATAPPVAPVAPVAPAPAPSPASAPAPEPVPPVFSTPPRAQMPFTPRGTTPPGGEPAGRESVEKMSTRRKRIAENLLLAQHATAHLTTFNEIDMSAIVAFRERLKDKVEQQFGVKLSYMPFFAKAAAMALKAYPVVNAQIDGETIIYKRYVNLGIAVASEAGLVVPVLRDAHTLGIIGLGRAIAEIAKRARDSKLTLDDLTGGTFTITNGGVFGSLLSTPIINYPQSAILGLHKMQDRPMAVAGRVEIRPVMYVALSYDHRIIDGQQAVQFLVRVKELMEDPAAMLLE